NAHPDDQVPFQNVECSAEAIAAPICFVPDTINLLRWILLFLFLRFFASPFAFLFVSRIVSSLFCGARQRVLPILSGLGSRRTVRLGLKDRQAHGHVWFPGSVITL